MIRWHWSSTPGWTCWCSLWAGEPSRTSPLTSCTLLLTSSSVSKFTKPTWSPDVNVMWFCVTLKTWQTERTTQCVVFRMCVCVCFMWFKANMSTFKIVTCFINQDYNCVFFPDICWRNLWASVYCVCDRTKSQSLPLTISDLFWSSATVWGLLRSTTCAWPCRWSLRSLQSCRSPETSFCAWRHWCSSTPVWNKKITDWEP